MKVASWGCCVLVFDSSGEPATHPGDASAVVPDFSGSEFEVGRISSCDEVATRDERSPMGCTSSLYQFFHIILAVFGTTEYVWYFIGVSEGAMMSSDCDDVPTEVETRSQCRRRRAVVTRRLVPLAGGASVPFAGSSHERSRELLEEAFDVGMYHIRWVYVLVVFQYCSSFLVLRDFRPFQ